jgi:TRAP-type C4-dicarboxylate transport system substrate-binding protein
VIGETLRAWGASPAGMPPGEMAENLDKGVIDGVVMPYDGMLGFRLAPYLRYSTEVFSYVSSFAVVMNPESYASLPPDLKRLIDDTTGKGAAREVGARWDAIEPTGRGYMVDNGVEIIELTDEQRAAFTAAAESIIEQRLTTAEAEGVPAREFFARLRQLAAQY